MSSHAFAAKHIEQTLKKEGHIRLSAIGFSMLPLIHPGSEMEIITCSFPEVKTGDIVLIKKDGFFLLHRIYLVSGETPSTFITKGDNTDRYDNPVGIESIAGKVVSVGKSLYAKMLWRIGNRIAILSLIQIPRWHKRLAEMPWYKALIHVKNRAIGKKALIAPLIKKTSSFIPWLARAGQRVKAKKNSVKLTILLPKTHVLEVGTEGPMDKIWALWNRSFPDLCFESAKALNNNLFFHPLADNPVCFLAERKGQCLGLLSAVQRFPNAWGEILCSLEAIAVDPNFRRKGVGTALLETLKSKCLANGIRRMATCKNYLFFTGLHPESHEKAILFFLKNGFGAPTFLDEIFFPAESIVTSKTVKATEPYCSGQNFSFHLLSGNDKEAFLAFLQKEKLETWGRYVQKNLLANLRPDHEGLFVAKHGDAIVGCARYDRLTNGKGPGGFYREGIVRKLIRATPHKVFILSHLFLLKNYRGRGIGWKLFKVRLARLLELNPEGFIFDTQMPSLRRNAGYRKIGQHLKLHASIST